MEVQTEKFCKSGTKVLKNFDDEDDEYAGLFKLARHKSAAKANKMKQNLTGILRNFNPKDAG